MAKIIPGILTNDEKEYSTRLRMAEHVCDLIQIDLVDGKFSENKTVGIETIKKYPSSVQLEVQLMVVDPHNYISKLAQLEFVSRIIFPLEIDFDINQNLYSIKSLGRQAAISLNPETRIESANRFLEDIDFLLLMTGKPGYSGQQLSPNTYKKIQEVKKIAPNLPVEIDIGVNFENANALVRAGADFLVTSSTIYNASDFRTAYEKLVRIANMKQ